MLSSVRMPGCNSWAARPPMQRRQQPRRVHGPQRAQHANGVQYHLVRVIVTTAVGMVFVPV